MRKNILYIANPWNQAMFNTSTPKDKKNISANVDRFNQNIFDGVPSLGNIAAGNYSASNLSVGNASVLDSSLNTSAINNSINNTTIKGFTSSGPQAASVGGGSSSMMGKAAAAKALMNAGFEATGLIGKSEKNPRGLWDAADPVHQLAGGRESAVGNSLEDAGVSTFKSGAQSGNGYMMLAGAGLKVAGGLTNAAFGTKVDKEKLNAINTGINTLKNFTSNAATYDEIEAPEAIIDGTSVYRGGWFTSKKASRKNNELAKRVAQAESWANRSVENNVHNIANTQLDNMLANYAAFGGLLNKKKRNKRINKRH